jgi:hypothetical protein
VAAPNPSNLDADQCIRGAYEDATGRLRVDAQITAPLDVNGEVLVDVRAGDGDSVLVYGTTNGQTTGTPQVLKVNPDGSINAEVTIVPSEPLTIYSVFNAITSVPNGVLTPILTYTVPTGATDYVEEIEVSGTNMAQFEVYINGVLSARQRTGLLDFNATFNFTGSVQTGLPLTSGTVIQVQVIQNRPDLGDYEARMIYAQ